MDLQCQAWGWKCHICVRNDSGEHQNQSGTDRWSFMFLGMRIHSECHIPRWHRGHEAGLCAYKRAEKLQRVMVSYCQERLALVPTASPQMPRAKRAGCLICCAENTNRSVSVVEEGRPWSGSPARWIPPSDLMVRAICCKCGGSQARGWAMSPVSLSYRKGRDPDGWWEIGVVCEQGAYVSQI